MSYPDTHEIARYTAHCATIAHIIAMSAVGKGGRVQTCLTLCPTKLHSRRQTRTFGQAQAEEIT